MHKCGKELLFIQFCIHYITRPHLVGIELENEMFTTMSCSFFRIYFLYFVSYKKGGVCETSVERTEGWYFSIYHWHLFINIKTQWTMVMQPNIQHNPPPLVPHFLLVFSHFILHHFSPHFFFYFRFKTRLKYPNNATDGYMEYTYVHMYLRLIT